MPQPLELLIAADDLARHAARRLRDGDGRQRHGDGGVVREVQAVHHLARAGPQAWILLQHLDDQLIDRARQLRVGEGRRLRRLPHQRVKRAELRRRREWMASGDELVEHDAEREDVGFLRDHLASRLLRRHIGDGTEQQARFGRRRRLPDGCHLRLDPRQAEVEQLDVAVGAHHHVVGLDVAVHDLGGVRDRQRLRNLPRDAKRTAHGEALPRDLAQRAAFDQFHRDVAIGIEDSGFVDRDDVRVVQRRGENGFAQQTIERAVLAIRADREDAADDLERDVA